MTNINDIKQKRIMTNGVFETTKVTNKTSEKTQPNKQYEMTPRDQH